MVAICSKCKVKLKVDDAKLKPEGTRFKCPKCGAILLLRKPATGSPPSAPARASLDAKKIIVAHSNPDVIETARSILAAEGYQIIAASDGIDAMVRALKEFPFALIAEVGLPKIYGFELCKRLKERPETKGMKFVLITSIHDKTKYRRDPVSLHGADAYLDEFDVSVRLREKIEQLTTPSPPSGRSTPWGWCTGCHFR